MRAAERGRVTPQKSAGSGQNRREWLPWVAVGLGTFGVGCAALARMLWIINRDYGRARS